MRGDDRSSWRRRPHRSCGLAQPQSVPARHHHRSTYRTRSSPGNCSPAKVTAPRTPLVTDCSKSEHERGPVDLQRAGRARRGLSVAAGKSAPNCLREADPPSSATNDSLCLSPSRSIEYTMRSHRSQPHAPTVTPDAAGRRPNRRQTPPSNWSEPGGAPKPSSLVWPSKSTGVGELKTSSSQAASAEGQMGVVSRSKPPKFADCGAGRARTDDPGIMRPSSLTLVRIPLFTGIPASPADLT